MLEVRRWAEIRRMKEVEGVSIHEIARRTGTSSAIASIARRFIEMQQAAEADAAA